MILEVAIMKIKPELIAEFEAVFPRAAAISASVEGYISHELQRCVERAVAYGALAALDDRPRPGKEPTITPEAKAWLVSLACDKAKDHGYPHELWTNDCWRVMHASMAPRPGTCVPQWRERLAEAARAAPHDPDLVIRQTDPSDCMEGPM